MRPGLFWLLALLSPSVLLLVYLYQLHQLEQYHYYPALLLAIGTLVWTRWDRRVSIPDGALALTAMILALPLLLAGLVLWSPWLGAIAAVLVFAAFCLSHRERNGRTLLPIVFLAVMLIRLPLNLDRELTVWLQTKTAGLTSYLLDFAEIPNRLTGHVFHLASGELFVETACSGVQSVFTLLFCAVLIVVWYRRSLWSLPIYALAAITWAAAMNIVRVFVIAYSREQYGLDLSQGWRHSLLGYICLALAVLLLLSTDRLLRILLYPVREESSTGKYQNPAVNTWNWLFDVADSGSRQIKESLRNTPRTSKSLRLAFSSLAIIMAVTLIPQVWGAVQAFRTTLAYAGTEFWQPSEDTVKQATTDLVVAKYESFANKENPALGEHAHVWTCSLDKVGVTIVVSQYPDVHDLCECYQYNGWVLKDRNDRTDSNTDWAFSSAEFSNSDALRGYLIFSTLNSDGSPRRHNDLQTILRNRFVDGRKSTQTINIQFWVASETPLDRDIIERLEQLHLTVRDALREQLLTAGKERGI